MKRTTILLALALILLLTGAALANGTPMLERYVIGSGGGHVEVGGYLLDATLGQAVVGLDSQGACQLCSGFQCQPVQRLFLPLILRQQP